jgi:hypothetical protein
VRFNMDWLHLIHCIILYRQAWKEIFLKYFFQFLFVIS